MPSPITSSIARALADNRVTIKEMDGLIKEAKAQPLTAELKAELQTLLDLHSDKFGVTAKKDLQRYLGNATVVPSRVNLEDPALLDKHTTDTTWKPVEGGQLYVDGIDYEDVIQGSIANCYMAAAFSSVALQDPDAIKNAIRENADGTFTVSFYESSYYGTPKKVEVTVDGDLPQSSMGSLRYAKGKDRSELWPGILEKAFAQWKGGYEAIGNGGNAGTVFEALTGKRASYTSTTYQTADQIFSRIQTATASGKPGTAGTHGKDSGVDYNGTGVYAWHAYTIVGAVEENGEKFIQLRNPWGSHEHGSDGKDDGIFKMELSTFMKLYNSINLGG